MSTLQAISTFAIIALAFLCGRANGIYQERRRWHEQQMRVAERRMKGELP